MPWKSRRSTITGREDLPLKVAIALYFLEETMRLCITLGVTILLLVGAVGPADEPAKPGPDLAAFSKIVHKLVVAQLPKEAVDESGWGQTIPAAGKMSLPRLRQYIRVGDQLEVPHGFWRKVKLSMADPAQDVKLTVREFKPTDQKTYRVVIDAEAKLHGWTETQHWQKGLQLVGFIAEADTMLGLVLECDVAVKLDAKQFPPAVKVEPKVTSMEMELKDFALASVSLRRVGTVLEGEQAREAGNQFKGLINEALKTFEPRIRAMVNEAIVQSIREGKGQLSGLELLKALGGK